MAKYRIECQTCGVVAEKVRAASQPPPKFCSRKCAAAAAGPPMQKYEVECGECGREFAGKAQASRPTPRFCSPECYWANRRGRRFPKGDKSVRRGRVLVGRRDDGRPIFMQRSHWFWNLAHPDDPVQPGEHVHHIDRDITNDDPSNLAKYTADEHTALHASEGSLAGPPSVLSTRMSAYHKANPGKQRRGKPQTCPICGAEFYRPPSAKAQTCSASCQGQLRSLRAKRIASG